MKRTGILAASVAALTLFSLLGCGAPAIGHLQTITLTSSASSSGFSELKGVGGTVQLTATGNYTSGDTKDLTANVTYVITPTGADLNGFALPAPPQTMTVSSTGLATAVVPFVCTFHNAQTDSTKPPSYVLTGSYQIVVTFQGITSQPVFLGIASAAGDGPGAACGP